jgi:hypothetical protein
MKAIKNNRQIYSADDHRISLPHKAGCRDILLTDYFDNNKRKIYNEEFKDETGHTHHGSGFT